MAGASPEMSCQGVHTKNNLPLPTRLQNRHRYPKPCFSKLQLHVHTWRKTSLTLSITGRLGLEGALKIAKSAPYMAPGAARLEGVPLTTPALGQVNHEVSAALHRSTRGLCALRELQSLWAAAMNITETSQSGGRRRACTCEQLPV